MPTLKHDFAPWWLTTRAGDYGPEAPVPILQREWEFEQLLRLYRIRRPKAVLEIGSYHGGTLYHWLRDARPGATIVSLDGYYFNETDNRKLYPEWTPDNVNLVVVQGDSHDLEVVQRVARIADYDWVFIDADHTYSAVTSDWENYGPSLVNHGIVALHDIVSDPRTHPEIQVDQLWDQIRRAGYVTQELICNPADAWGGIGVVYL